MLSKLLSVFMVLSLAISIPITVNAENNAGITLCGYFINAAQSEQFIQNGFTGGDVFQTESVMWNLSGITVEGSDIHMGVNTISESYNVEGTLYQGFYQGDGYSYVAEISDFSYETLYFCICEKMESKIQFSQTKLSGAGILWYLRDASGNLIIFEQNIDASNNPFISIDSALLTQAPNECDTLWFVYKTNPILSTVEEPEDLIEPMTSINGNYTIWRGSTYTDTFSIAGMQYVTTCRPFIECVAVGSIPKNGASSEWTMNICIYQRVTCDGTDVTGKVSNVYSLRNINYRLALCGNALFYRFTKSCQLTGNTSVNVGTAAVKVVKMISNKTIGTITEMLNLLSTVLTSGSEVTMDSDSVTLTCNSFAVQIDDKYYISYDTEDPKTNNSVGNYAGCSFVMVPRDSSEASNTTATLGIQCSFNVYGGSTDVTVTPSIQKTFQTNVN